MPPEASSFMQQQPDFNLLQLAVYAVLGLVVVLALLTFLAVLSLPLFFGALGLLELGLRVVQNFPDPVGKLAKLAGLVFRSLRRNLLRTALTYVALFVLTAMLTLIYGVVKSIGTLTSEKEGSQMVILTEKYGIPSILPPAYANQLKSILAALPKDAQPADIDKNFMTWTFVGASLDPTKLSPENNFFLFALDPDSIPNGMMAEQGLSKDDLGPDWDKLLAIVDEVKRDKRNVVVGEEKLKQLGKEVGDWMKFTSNNYKELEFEVHVVGAFPAGSRLAGAAAMRYDYLLSKMDEYKGKQGKQHPMADRCLNLVWVRMPSKAAYEQLAEVVNKPGTFSNPAAKMETFSAAIGSFLEPLKDIFWGLQWIVAPAILGIMCLVIAITITIGVRERWAEMAVLKVLGFLPWQVTGMIVAEAVLIGVFGGLLATWAVYFLPMAARELTHAFGARVAFFENLKSPREIVLLGPLLGTAVGLIGAALPSWNARKVKVSEVFAQVA